MTPDADVRATVLVVDDERELTELYASWLADDYDVRTATDGEAALAQLTPAVDAVLLDRRMPDVTGAKCSRRSEPGISPVAWRW